MTILHYIPSIDVTSGGVGSYMQLISRDLGKLCDLHIVTHKTDNMLPLENCTIHFISDGLSAFYKVKRQFKTLLSSIKPDVFHSNCCWTPYCAYTLMWAKQEGYKTVLSPHGMLEPWILQRNYWKKKLPAILLYQRKAVRLADVVHATARNEKEHLNSLGWNNNVTIIPNCVQIDKIILKQEWNHSKTILFLSRIHPKKGIEMLIQSVAKLKNALAGWTVSIIGNGDEKYIQKLKEMSLLMGVDRIVKFHEPVFGQQKFELYRNADLFVLPTYSENFGIVVAEALACGTPVITTQGAPWENLITYNCGWWCEPNVDSLTKSLNDFISKSPNELEIMGRNGRKLMEEKYSSVSVSNMFVEMYDSLIL